MDCLCVNESDILQTCVDFFCLKKTTSRIRGAGIVIRAQRCVPENRGTCYLSTIWVCCHV